MVVSVKKNFKFEDNKICYPFLICYLSLDKTESFNIVVFAVDESDALSMFEVICYRDNIECCNPVVHSVKVFDPCFLSLEQMPRMAVGDFEV